MQILNELVCGSNSVPFSYEVISHVSLSYLGNVVIIETFMTHILLHEQHLQLIF